MHSGSFFTKLKMYNALYTYCCHVENLSSCLLKKPESCHAIGLRPFLRRERKQEYLNPGKMYVREPACCLCCSSSPLQECGSVGVTGSLQHTCMPLLHTSHPTLSLSYVTSNRTPLPVPYPQSPPTFTHWRQRLWDSSCNPGASSSPFSLF